MPHAPGSLHIYLLFASTDLRDYSMIMCFEFYEKGEHYCDSLNLEIHIVYVRNILNITVFMTFGFE